MANLSAFYETKRTFYAYIPEIKLPLTFEQWNNLPSEKKSAALYLQFYNEICTAWNKANAFDFIDGEEGVEVVCQYLQKNVERVENDSKKFSAPYFYRVAYNCMYCICHDLKSVQDRWENETSPIIEGSDSEEIDLIDKAVDNSGSAEDSYERETWQNSIWAVIEDCGLETEKVVRYLLSNNKDDLKKLSKRSKNYKNDPLRDIEVSLDAVEDIISDLRVKLARFASELA